MKKKIIGLIALFFLSLSFWFAANALLDHVSKHRAAWANRAQVVGGQ